MNSHRLRKTFRFEYQGKMNIFDEAANRCKRELDVLVVLVLVASNKSKIVLWSVAIGFAGCWPTMHGITDQLVLYILQIEV